MFVQKFLIEDENILKLKSKLRLHNYTFPRNKIWNMYIVYFLISAIYFLFDKYVNMVHTEHQHFTT